MENVMDREGAILKAHDEKKMILPDASLCETDGRVTRINNNVIVLGTSGGGKTRSVVIPNILAANDSMIISDPKGNLYKECGDYLKDMGYRVFHLDLIHPETSDHYNPLAYVKTSDDIMNFAHLLCYSNGGVSSGEATGTYDPFWDRASELLISAVLGLLTEVEEIHGSEGKRQISEIIRLLEKIDANVMEDGGKSELDLIMDKHREAYLNETKENSWAFRQWRKFRQTPARTFNSILITTNAMLATLDTKGMQQLMSSDVIHLERIGKRPTAVFVETSDTDRSKDLLANVFYGQAMNVLCSQADALPQQRLKVPVRFILDDFGTVCRIDNFDRMISNVRSRNISAMIVLQSLAQLEAGYGASAHTIINNCDTLLYMGGNDVDTAQYVSRRSAKSLRTILEMPVGMHWQFRRGRTPRIGHTVDLSEYEWERKPAAVKGACRSFPLQHQG